MVFVISNAIAFVGTVLIIFRKRKVQQMSFPKATRPADQG